MARETKVRFGRDEIEEATNEITARSLLVLSRSKKKKKKENQKENGRVISLSITEANASKQQQIAFVLNGGLAQGSR